MRHPGCQPKWEDGWNAKPFPLWSSATSLTYWNAFSTSYLSGPCKHPIISNHFTVPSAMALHFCHAMWSIPFFWHAGKSYLMISKGGNVSCQRRLPENRVQEHWRGPERGWLLQRQWEEEEITKGGRKPMCEISHIRSLSESAKAE